MCQRHRHSRGRCAQAGGEHVRAVADGTCARAVDCRALRSDARQAVGYDRRSRRSEEQVVYVRPITNVRHSLVLDTISLKLADGEKFKVSPTAAMVRTRP